MQPLHRLQFTLASYNPPMFANCPSRPALLDIRPSDAFAVRHLPHSANIPLEELAGRIHELPDRYVLVCLIDTDPGRLAAAQAALCSRGYHSTAHLVSSEEFIESGPPQVHLWQPTGLLRQAIDVRPPPPSAKALDLACGTGRDAVYLALHGYSVDAVDILPDALARATSLAQKCRVSVQPLLVDLRHGWPFTIGSYDLVCVFRFLHRPILSRLPSLLRPGGLLVIETFHQASANTPHGPTNPSHLLATGELRQTFARLEILHQADAVERTGRFFSQLIARIPIPADV